MSALVSLTDFVEIAEVGNARIANDYLSHGYRYAGFIQIAKEKPASAPEGSTRQAWVLARYGMHVLGRTADVKHYDPPKREQASPAGAA